MDGTQHPEDATGSPLGRAGRLLAGALRAPRPRLSLAQAAIAGAILLVGLVAGALILESQRDAARASQDRSAERAVRALREEVEQATLLARAARGLMERAEPPSHAEFARFTEVSMEGTHLLGLSWMPRVSDAERPGWEGRTGHAITRFAGIAQPTRLGRRAVYFPVADFAPTSRWTDMLLGLDPGTIPGLEAARARARDEGRVALAPPVQLAGTATLGMNLFAAVYRPGAPTGTVAERRAALHGYVAATYRLSDIVGEAFEALPAGARMRILDAGSVLEGSSPEALERPSRQVLDAGGRRLEVLVTAGSGASVVPALVAAAVGAVVSVLVALMFVLANRRRDESERVAAEEGALLRVATAVAVMAAPDDVFRLVAGEAAVLLGAEAGAVYRFTPAGPVRADAAASEGPCETLLPARPAWGVVTEVARTGESARRRVAAREWVAAPIRVGGELWGAVAVSGHAGAPIDPDASGRMDRFGRLTAVAIADAEARDALRASEERLRRERDYAESLLEAMQDGIVMLGPDGRISEVSRGFCELTGFAREQLLGAAAPYPYWPEATEEGVRRGFARIRAAGSYEWDLPFRTRDGRRIAVILRASVLRDAAGDTMGYLATVKDVTERRRAEDELRHQVGIVRAVLDTAPEAILMVGLDGRAAISNPAADRLSRLLGDDGDPCSGAVAELTADPDAYRAAIELLAGDPAITTTQEFELVASGRIFRRYSAPVRADGAGAIVGRLFVTDEVTDERRAERAKDEFVQLASHELRTPLTSILGYLEVLQEDEAEGLTPEQLRFVDVVHRNAQRLLLLVGDLLVVARADAGRLGLEMHPVALDGIVREATEGQRLIAEERRIALSAEAEPLALQGDRGRLGEVIDNLLSNALKFTPPGGRVSVRAARDGTGAVIEVTDTGMGIPATEQDRLFERFYRTQAALTAAIPGTGLGLTIAKMIVEAHGGRIGVESEEGRGTTFRIWLPASEPPAAAGHAPGDAEAQPAPVA